MKYELLLPAGDLNRLKFAFLYGADAVYIGGEYYSLRANANNFTSVFAFTLAALGWSLNKDNSPK